MRRLKLTAVALLCFAALAQAASAQLPAETVAARQHFFGAENVRPDGSVRADRVILSWFSVASVAAALNGHVVLLDAYIHKEEDVPNYVPTTTEELVALRPEAIFIGHGHFDHGALAGEIVARTGAFVVGTPEHCDQVKQLAADHARQAVDVRCIDAVTRGSEPAAEVNELRPFADGPEVTALKHVHSAAEAPDGENHETTLGSGALPDPRLVLLHPPGPSVLSNLTLSGDEGSSVLYQFRLGGFALVWHDTAGPLRERAPKVFDVLSGLPQTDVEVGSVLGFNDPTNGLRDIVDYVERLRPRLFFPIHHDFVAEYGASQRMPGVMAREMARRDPIPTELRWLSDPQDYLRPGLMTFDHADPAWGPAPVARRCMSRKLRVRPRGIGFVRIGSDRDALARRTATIAESGRTLTFCVGGEGSGAVGAVRRAGGGVHLIATTAPVHRTRGVGVGSRTRAMRKRYRRTRALGGGLFRASPGSRILFVTRSGRVRAVVVADRRLLRDRRALRAELRLGLTAAG